MKKDARVKYLQEKVEYLERAYALLSVRLDQARKVVNLARPIAELAQAVADYDANMSVDDEQPTVLSAAIVSRDQTIYALRRQVEAAKQLQKAARPLRTYWTRTDAFDQALHAFERTCA